MKYELRPVGSHDLHFLIYKHFIYSEYVKNTETLKHFMTEREDVMARSISKQMPFFAIEKLAKYLLRQKGKNECVQF